jgi:peroxiredoxin
MSMKKINFCLLILFCSTLLTLSNCTAQEKSIAPKSGIDVGQLATDFTLNDLSGKKVTLSSFKNKKAVILSFWATWCPYCVREIPKLKELHSKFKDRNLEIISINIAANDPISRVIEFEKKQKLPYPVLYDKDQTISRTYAVSGIPVTLIINPDGLIVFRGYGLPEDAGQYFDKNLATKK